jgi:type I restriction-modification system DNA methylase subunit
VPRAYVDSHLGHFLNELEGVANPSSDQAGERKILIDFDWIALAAIVELSVSDDTVREWLEAAISELDYKMPDPSELLGDPANVRQNLDAYVQGFSAEVRDIFERFDFAVQIDKLAKAKLLFVAEKFAGIDLHPDRVSNNHMGLVFEELIRKFAEASNETAGDHFTPRDVIRLMVDLLFIEDDDALSKPGVVRTIYDPTAGTGGMLSVAEEHLKAGAKDVQLDGINIT